MPLIRSSSPRTRQPQGETSLRPEIARYQPALLTGGGRSVGITTTGSPTRTPTAHGIGWQYGSGKYHSVTAAIRGSAGVGNDPTVAWRLAVSFVVTSNGALDALFSVAASPTDGAPTVLVQNNSGTLRVLMTLSSSYVDIGAAVVGKLHTLEVRYTDMAPYTRSVYLDGRFAYSENAYSAWGTAVAYIGSGYPSQTANALILQALWQQGAGLEGARAIVDPWGDIYLPTERRIWVPSAGGGVTAALSRTLGDLTGAATGQLRIAGSVSQTLGTLTSTAAGQLPIVGSLSQALGALASSATGQLRIAGAASQTLGALSLASTGVLGSAVTGSLSQTLGALSLAASGQLPIVGSLGQTLGGLSSSATGTLGNALTGALSQTLGALTVSAAGTLPINAALSQTLGTLTVVGAGVVPIVAQTAQTLGALTLASTGVLGATTSGVVTQTLGPLALSATARLPITAAVSQSLGALTSAAAGRVDIAAQLGVTLGNLQIAATGSTGAPITAALAPTLGLLSLSATGGAAVVPAAPLSRITAGATRSNLSRGSRPPNLSGSGR